MSCIYWFQKQLYSGIFLKRFSPKFQELIRNNLEFEENSWKNIFVGVKYQFQTFNLQFKGTPSQVLLEICHLSRKTLQSNTSEWLLLLFSICYSDTKLTMKQMLNCFIGINFLPTHILNSLQNTTETSILNDAYQQKSRNCMCQTLW